VSDLSFTAGSVHNKDQPPASGTPFNKVIAAAKTSSVSGQGRSKGTISDMIGVTKPSVSSHSYAAFVEVTWEPEIARLRLSRIVTTVDAGRIINELTGRNQIEGAVAIGIGMALFEEFVHDPRSGAPINSNLADYILTTHADAPPHEVGFIQHPDLHLNELGRPRHWRNRPGGNRFGDHLRHPPRHGRAHTRAACPGRGSAAIAGHLSRAAGRVGGTMQARPATTQWRC
jgi:xanthine dehydrogenase YagR molybdenum-binding subunit